MNEELAKRLRELLLDGKWIANTNFQDEIRSTSWQEAIYKHGKLNSIALLTFHINYYLNGLCNVFEGGGLEIRDKYSFEMPAIGSQSDWDDLIYEFLGNAERFSKHVSNMDEQQLQQPFVKEEFGTYQRNIEAQIEHGYYHLGQVVILKKLLEQMEN